MSKTEGFLMHDSRTAAAAIGAPDKAEVAAKALPHNVARGKLADISNLPQKAVPLTQDQKSQLIPTTVKDYIEQLQKDNMALAKMLAQRNKIVEQSGIELERLRLNFIKMREQNQQLAMSNTQMLAELNSGKDRLKALQHELGCKNGLLQAKRQKPEVDIIDEDQPSEEGSDYEKPRKAKRRLRSLSVGSSEQSQSDDNAANRLPTRRQSARFKATKPNDDSLSVDESVLNEECVSLRPSVRRQSTKFKAVDDQPDINGASTSLDTSIRCEDGNRPSSRRQSARFKAHLPKQSDDQENESSGVKNEEHISQRPSMRKQSKGKRSKEGDDSSIDEPIGENGSTSIDSSVKDEDRSESQECRKQSLRPSRVAAKKVNSYKEIPLNVKMRRSE